jgi:pimeloyl-ACP methyl ester carboxylesterase
MFPLEHGEALAEAIPDASLMTLERAGHGVDRRDWEIIVRAILEHTAPPKSSWRTMTAAPGA